MTRSKRTVAQLRRRGLHVPTAGRGRLQLCAACEPMWEEANKHTAYMADGISELWSTQAVALSADRLPQGAPPHLVDERRCGATTNAHDVRRLPDQVRYINRGLEERWRKRRAGGFQERRKRPRPSPAAQCFSFGRRGGAPHKPSREERRSFGANRAWWRGRARRGGPQGGRGSAARCVTRAGEAPVDGLPAAPENAEQIDAEGGRGGAPGGGPGGGDEREQRDGRATRARVEGGAGSAQDGPPGATATAGSEGEFGSSRGDSARGATGPSPESMDGLVLASDERLLLAEMLAGDNCPRAPT